MAWEEARVSEAEAEVPEAEELRDIFSLATLASDLLP
jgi:hypothetical protein